ncbi:GDSL esterase/lipase 2-like isoform X1 [Carya illinoinensis]|uniref:GDSL esterase/lipase 2-like isoform X1 n=1 Tax=Carya illinoinensis TaxID=32201 RepID=UPI001C71A661|nr:GDSL esterase/lipase 2-like isoform X1 [Carya illinoinensis]
MASLRWSFCFLVLYATLLTHCHGRRCQPEKHVALFVFGDSLFDAGNNNYVNVTAESKANFEPYGMTTFKYPNGRFSDGRIAPDFIAEYAKLPYIAPYLHPGYHLFVNGANFASAGASALGETHQGSAIHLKTQLGYFKNLARLFRRKLGDAGARKLLERAVYLISIGANDYPGSSISNSSRPSPSQEYVDMVIGNLTFVLSGIYEQGGRKFGFPSVPPILLLPSRRAGTVASKDETEKITELIKLHDNTLSRALQELERQLHGFRYSKTTLSTFLSERINSPSKYGFKEGEIACCGTGPYRGLWSCGGKRRVKEYEVCGNPREYVFFDSAHPSEKTHQQLAELMWSGPPNLIGPYNLKALFEL